MVYWCFFVGHRFLQQNVLQKKTVRLPGQVELRRDVAR